MTEQLYFLPIWERLTHEERVDYCQQEGEVVVSSSSGIDSLATLITAREMFPHRKIRVHHQYLAESWHDDLSYLVLQCEAVSNCHLTVSQGVRQLTGGFTPTGAYATTLHRLHTIYDNGFVADPLPPADDLWREGRPKNIPGTEITSLLDLAVIARGAPPTKKIRYCSAYMKSDVFNRWLQDNGFAHVFMMTGERHAESQGREKLAASEWRFGRQKNDAYWHRPIVTLKFHEVLRKILEFTKGDIELIPRSYGWQFATGHLEDFIAYYLDPEHDEGGRARRSCVRCIFTTREATELLRASGHSVWFDARTDLAEKVMNMTWRQGDKKK